jgi:TIR domain
MDYQLKLAGIWNDEIDERVKTCAFFIPILSKATQDGAGCRFFRKEWQIALDARRTFLPVRLEECALPAALAEPWSQSSAGVSTRICFRPTRTA